jgi:hypothetical protein
MSEKALSHLLIIIAQFIAMGLNFFAFSAFWFGITDVNASFFFYSDYFMTLATATWLIGVFTFIPDTFNNKKVKESSQNAWAIGHALLGPISQLIYWKHKIYRSK